VTLFSLPNLTLRVNTHSTYILTFTTVSNVCFTPNPTDEDAPKCLDQRVLDTSENKPPASAVRSASDPNGPPRRRPNHPQKYKKRSDGYLYPSLLLQFVTQRPRTPKPAKPQAEALRIPQRHTCPAG
jgi:hypothetical protein